MLRHNFGGCPPALVTLLAVGGSFVASRCAQPITDAVGRREGSIACNIDDPVVSITPSIALKDLP